MLTDLGSTNGTRVNGQRIREVVLGAGDQIGMGDTVLVLGLRRPSQRRSVARQCRAVAQRMDPALLAVWILRLLFLGLLYVFLAAVVRVLLRDLRAAAREPGTELGRLTILASPSGEPAVGSSFGLDAVATLGRDVNNAIVLEDDFVSSTHATSDLRGRTWYVEDAGSTNGTFVNGNAVDGLAPIAFGDELCRAAVRLRLDRAQR